MARVRSFDAPHKGLRNILSKFSLLAGQTDYSDVTQLERLKRLGEDMFTLLNDHVNTENAQTLRRLEERVSGASEHDKHDHEELEAVQDELEARLRVMDIISNTDEGHRFYLDFTQYHGRYLEHTFHEETVTEKLLQDNFTDEELITHRIEIMQQMDFSMLLLWLKYTIPAQTEVSSVVMLSGLKANVPKEAFERIWTTIEAEMKVEEFASLEQKLSQLDAVR